MSDAAKWYVVHTYSGYENKVASSIEKAVENRKLHDLIQAVNIPTEKVVEVKDGKSREVERKLYPGYVLVKMIMTDETWYLVRNTRGCTGFLGQDKSGGSKPIPLTEEEIIAMGVEKREIEVNYAAGDSVRVIDGAPEMLRRLTNYAVPSIAQQSFVSVGNVVIQYYINLCGATVIAGFSAANRVNQFALTCCMSFASGLSSYVAQNIGARTSAWKFRR